MQTLPCDPPKERGGEQRPRQPHTCIAEAPSPKTTPHLHRCSPFSSLKPSQCRRRRIQKSQLFFSDGSPPAPAAAAATSMLLLYARETHAGRWRCACALARFVGLQWLGTMNAAWYRNRRKRQQNDTAHSPEPHLCAEVLPFRGSCSLHILRCRGCGVVSMRASYIPIQDYPTEIASKLCGPVHLDARKQSICEYVVGAPFICLCTISIFSNSGTTSLSAVWYESDPIKHTKSHQRVHSDGRTLRRQYCLLQILPIQHGDL